MTRTTLHVVRPVHPNGRSCSSPHAGVMALAGLGFAALFILDPNTQLLALCFGVALVLLASALIIAGRWLVPQETTVEDRPMYGDREACAR